jgi:hypothetical protein
MVTAMILVRMECMGFTLFFQSGKCFRFYSTDM